MNSRVNVSQHTVLSPLQPFKMSKAALGLILTAFLLVGLLTFSAIKNIYHARSMMEKFLVQKGEMIIRSIEAGTRTMMHYMGEGNPLETLITENGRENDIIFIRILNRQGEVLAETGDGSSTQFFAKEVVEIMDKDMHLAQFGKKEGLFTLSRKFHLVQRSGMPMMRKRQRLRNRFHLDEMIISVGLLTTEFDMARKQDVRHTLFMVAILFLVGSAGFYFLFLYQGMRVASVTLANLKL